MLHYMGRMGSRMGGYVRAANMTKEQTQRGRPEGVLAARRKAKPAG